MSELNPDLQAWLQSVPSSITGDAVWKIEAYRLGLYSGDIGWDDVSRTAEDKRTVQLSGQLYRALGSISANIAEGFSRSSHKDKARLYEYALGYARESRDWYYKARHVLGQELVGERHSVLNQVIRLLLTMIPNQRSYMVREDSADYHVDEDPPVG
jgi:four helix bundle protein